MTQDKTLSSVMDHALLWRYATKKFDPNRTISSDQWQTLEDTLRFSPSSFGLQPWHFIVVVNPDLRKKLQTHSWNQPQIVEASHLVVLASARAIDESYIDSCLSLTAETRGIAVSDLAAYRGMIVPFVAALQKAGQLEAWTTRQTYLALGMLLHSAAMLGIDACPLEGIDPGQYDQILGLADSNYGTRVACALGYRASDDKAAMQAKVRFPSERVFSYRK
jgi:nitroreductase